ncbi:MAG: pyridoxal phosphate-dependent aminotransferase [Flavobacteriaceae bacterium]|jgi:aspartate aminotransferase|nr:pyridoxal phosphate-dependent aminotransferase [Flavobacteriaceae bacterium]
MPSVSDKGKKLPSSPIRKLTEYADKAKKSGVEVFHLNIGQPDIASPKVALEAVKNNTLEILSYGPSEGSEAFRSKMSDYYAGHQISITSDQILVTTGASEALTMTLGCIANEGDEIIIPEPFYANYGAFAAANGIRICPVTSSLENQFALPPIAEIEALISSKTKAILICNPNNPTGYLYSEKEIRELGEIAIKHDIFLISDEVYREFVYDGAEHFSILQIPNIAQHGILIDSMSKRYSMCGARIGCIVTKNEEVIATALKYAQSRLSPPSYAMIASEAALDTPKNYFEEINLEYQNRRNTLINGLRSIEGVTVAKPQGAFYCLVKLPIDDAEHFAQWLLEQFNDNNQTIMVAPANGFYSSSNEGKNMIRIAYVLNEKALNRSVDLLKKALDLYSNP